jgi:ABC-type sugar transport system substrate-binding protein
MNRYEIQVVGLLDARRARALGAETCRWFADGSSVLVVDAVDQAATYGVLARLRDAGLELVSIVRIPSATAESQAGVSTTKGTTR